MVMMVSVPACFKFEPSRRAEVELKVEPLFWVWYPTDVDNLWQTDRKLSTFARFRRTSDRTAMFLFDNLTSDRHS